MTLGLPLEEMSGYDAVLLTRVGGVAVLLGEPSASSTGHAARALATTGQWREYINFLVPAGDLQPSISQGEIVEDLNQLGTVAEMFPVIGQEGYPHDPTWFLTLPDEDWQRLGVEPLELMPSSKATMSGAFPSAAQAVAATAFVWGLEHPTYGATLQEMNECVSSDMGDRPSILDGRALDLTCKRGRARSMEWFSTRALSSTDPTDEIALAGMM